MTKDAKPQAKKPQKDSSTGLWLDAAGVPIHVGDTLKCIGDFDSPAWVMDVYMVVGNTYKVRGMDNAEWIPIRIQDTESCTQWVNPSNYLVI